MNLITTKKRGFSLLKFIIVVAILIIFISLLGFNIEEDIVMNPAVQTNFSFIMGWLSNIWDNHLASPLLYVWNDVIIEMLWEPFVEGFLSGDFINQIQSPSQIQ